jgi:hypothetical protein
VTRRYKYANIGDYILCLGQSPVWLAWVLFFNRKILLSIYKPWLREAYSGFKAAYLRLLYKTFKSNLKVLLSFMACRFMGVNGARSLELPAYGQFCKEVHVGYKIFDIRNGSVTKVFGRHVSDSIVVRQIEVLRGVADVDFAPRIREWNVVEKWYEEEYINGYCSSSKYDWNTVFLEDLVFCWNRLACLKPPFKKKVQEYVAELVNFLGVNESVIRACGRTDDIKRFLTSVTERFGPQVDNDIYLVFSHGDFCAANILRTRKGIKIVDWEESQFRSACFDFYSYFFFGPVCREVPVKNLLKEIETSLPALISSMGASFPEMSESLRSLRTSYRNVFYLEEVCRLVARSFTENHLNMCDFIRRYIKAFADYEEAISK